MIHFLPDPETATPAPIVGEPLARAAMLARIASLRHAARLLKVGNDQQESSAARRIANRAARDAAAGIEAALQAFASQAEEGRSVNPAALDALARELDQSLASLDLMRSL